MRAVVFTVLAALLVLLSNDSKASVITQISDPFAPVQFSGFNARVSQFDTGGTFGNFATVYDNFSFGTGGYLSRLEWVGNYSVAGAYNPSFEVNIYLDVLGEPAAVPSYSTSVTPGSESLISTFAGVDYFRYSADLPLFTVNGGTTYWLSIVAQIDSNDDVDWGWANSDLGDMVSIQDFGPDRFDDDVDAAFNLTMIPEPSSLLVVAFLTVGLGFVRVRRDINS